MSTPTPDQTLPEGAFLQGLQSLRAACSNCNLRELCLPVGLSADEMQRVDELVRTRRQVLRGEHLFRTGDAFHSLVAVRTGFFKTKVLLADGREQVTGFHMAGEVIGLDGIGNERHTCDAVALEDSEVCVLPYGRLAGLSREVEALHRRLHQIMSSEIVREHGVMLLLGSMRAGERVVAFLLNLSRRLAMRGYSERDLHLRMTREELGSYLGVKLETVSRALSKLQADGLLEVSRRNVRLLDLPALRALLAKSE